MIEQFNQYRPFQDKTWSRQSWQFFGAVYSKNCQLYLDLGFLMLADFFKYVLNNTLLFLSMPFPNS